MFRIGDLAKKLDNQRLYLIVEVMETMEKCIVYYIYDNPKSAKPISCSFSELEFISHLI